MKEYKSSEVVFFLGAGASVGASVPDTHSFVNEFKNSIYDMQRKQTVIKIIEVLEKWKGQDIDIELLLETLTKLESKEQEPLLRFFENGRFILENHSAKKPIIEDLKDFIKSKVIIKDSEKINYLQPLLGFLEEFTPLDIISVNYDTCIEQFCNKYKLIYQDGFEINWNPKVFEREDTDIRLFKLHGSVMWYRSDRGGYIKLPVMTEKAGLQLITGERAESLMLYPMQKWDYAEPLLELLINMKRLLEKCRFLITVGHSFRDEHIRRILWDVARKNKNLHLILIDPNAYQIYREKLKCYSTGIPSSLANRVICLPFKFEGFFPYLKDFYLKNIREGLNNEQIRRRNELLGEKAQWITCISPLLNAGYVEKVKDILTKIEPSELEKEWELALEIPVKMSFYLALNKQKEESKKYIKDFNKRFHLFFVERLNANVMTGPPIIEIYFNCVKNDSGTNRAGVGRTKTLIESMYQYIDSRSKIALNTAKEIENIKEKLKAIRNYLKPFDEKGIRMEQYIYLRTKEIDNVEKLKTKFEEYEKKYSQELGNELSNYIIQIEKRLIQKLWDTT